MFKCIKIMAQHHAPVYSHAGFAQSRLTNHELVNTCINVETLGNSVCTHREVGKMLELG